MTKITLGELPVHPEGSEARGLTTELWNGLAKCWHTKPEDRITVPEVLELLTPNTRDHQLLDLGTSLPTETTSHRPSNDQTHTARLSETTGMINLDRDACP